MHVLEKQIGGVNDPEIAVGVLFKLNITIYTYSLMGNYVFALPSGNAPSLRRRRSSGPPRKGQIPACPRCP